MDVNVLANRLHFLILCIFFLAPFSGAWAFKYDSHFYIGQQIINDIMEDVNAGRAPKLSVQVGNEIHELDPDPRLVEAIKQYPDLFRLSTLGPDAFPDMIGGQFSVHPGVVTQEELNALEDRNAAKDANGNPAIKKGWKTDDWMQFIHDNSNLDNPKQAAFFFGYMVHAASDVWAHSYVNMYSGDHFWLTDDEIEVEKRHVALERYIDYRLPDVAGLDGTVYKLNDFYAISDQTKDDYANYIAKLLILDDQRLGFQYENGMAPHLDFFNTHYHRIKEFKEHGIDRMEQRVLDLLATIFSAQEYRDLLNLQKNEFLAVAGNVVNSTDVNIVQNVDAYLSYAQTTWNISSGRVPELETMATMKQAYIDFHANYLSSLQLLNSTEKVKLTYRDVCFKAGVAYKCDKTKGLSNLLNVSIPSTFGFDCSSNWSSIFSDFGLGLLDIKDCSISNTWNTYNSDVSTALSGMSVNLSGMTGLANNNTTGSATQNVISAVDMDYSQYLNSLGMVDEPAFQQTITLEKYQDPNSNPIRWVLDAWLEDYKAAMKQYVKASIESTKRQQEYVENVPDQAERTKYLIQPFLEWESCWMKTVVLGYPAPLNQIECEVGQEVDRQYENLQQLKEDLLLFLLPQKAEEYYNEFQLLLVEAKNKAAEGAIRLISLTFLENQDVYGYSQILTGPFGPNKLRNIFSANVDDCSIFSYKSTCEKGLLIIPDILERVNAEMGVNADPPGTPYESRNRLDPGKYNVLFDAVQMAKLAVVHTRDINRWGISEFGMTNTKYSNNGLYNPLDPTTPPFILLSAISNIDGSNQWQPVNLPMGRSSWDKAEFDRLRYYGRHFNEVDLNDPHMVKGFRLFLDPQARTEIFQKVFRGPVAPGVESPDELGPGFSNLLGEKNVKEAKGYWGYRACSDYPFPVRTKDIDFRTGDTGFIQENNQEKLVLIEHRLWKDESERGDYYLVSDNNACGSMGLPKDFTGGTLNANYPKPYLYANSMYEIASDIIVPEGVTLTIKRGNQVVFHPNAKIDVYGSLISAGEAGTGNGVLLTSFKNNPAPGAWDGLVLRNTSQNNWLNYTTVSWAGIGILADNSNLVLDNSTLEHNQTGLLMTGINTLTNSTTSTVLASVQSFSTTTASPSQAITNSRIINNEIGVSLYGNALPRVNWNTLSGNALYNVKTDGYDNPASVYVDFEANWWGSETGLDIIGGIYDNIDNPNASPFVDFVPFQTQTGALTNGNILLGQIDSQFLSDQYTTYTAIGAVTVAEGDTLTIPEGNSFTFYGQNSELVIDGSLVTQGTADSPVTLLSSDVSSGWKGIRLSSTSTNTNIDGAVVKYAEYGVMFDNVGGTLTNSTLSNNRYGIYINGSADPIITNNQVTLNEIGINVRGDVEHSPNPVINYNNIVENTSFALDASYNPDAVLNVSRNWWGTTDVPTLIDLMYDNIDDPEASPEARFVPYLDSPGGQLTYGNAIAGDWQGKPAILEGKTYHVVGTTTIPAGRGMIVPRDTVFLYHNLAKPFNVEGTMDVQGLPGKPATFTSPYVPESTIRGQKPDLVIAPKRADARGVMAIPINNGNNDVRGAWYGIKVKDGGYVSIDSAIIEYASYGLYFDGADGLVNNTLLKNNTHGVWVQGGAPQVEYSRIYNNDVGVYVRGAQKEGYYSNPVVNYSALSNASFDYYVGTADYGMAEELDATNNWWWTKNLDIIADWIYDSNDDPEKAHAIVKFNPIVKSGPN